MLFIVATVIAVFGHLTAPASALQTEQQKLSMDAPEQQSCMSAAPAPWKTTIEKAYVLQVSRLPAHPTLDDAVYHTQQYPPGWTFVGGAGYVMLLRYSDTPVGPYSEMVYVPGRFQYSNCSTYYMSVGRIWVDSLPSVVGGRNNWGLPKRLANFSWHDLPSGGGESVAVTDSSTGQLLLSAELEPVNSRWPPVSTLAWVIKEQIQLIRPFLQVPVTAPVDDNRSPAPLSFQLSGLPTSVHWVKIRRDTASQTDGTTTHTDESSPNSTAVGQSLRWTVNHQAFTGRDDGRIVPLPAGQETGLRLGAGSIAVFPPAVEVTCSDSGLRNMLASMHAVGRSSWSLARLLARSLLR